MSHRLTRRTQEIKVCNNRNDLCTFLLQPLIWSPATLAYTLTHIGRIATVTSNCTLLGLRSQVNATSSLHSACLRKPNLYLCLRSFATTISYQSVLGDISTLAAKHLSGNVKAAEQTPTHPRLRSRAHLLPFTVKEGPHVKRVRQPKFVKVPQDAHQPRPASDHNALRANNKWQPILEPVEPSDPISQEDTRIPKSWHLSNTRRYVLDDRDNMSSSIEILTTPTADTAGTTLLLRTAAKAYVFGSQAEGTQRALVQQGARLLKAQDFFLTGKAEWRNTGGFVGLMLTLADATSSSYDTTVEYVRAARERGRTVPDPVKPMFNIYGPPNLKHTLGTCRRFIFRRGIPITATEYKDKATDKDGDGNIPPTWQDANIKVWALPVSPVDHHPDPQTEADLEARRQAFDARLNTFEDHKAPESETPEEREERYDRIRSATVKFMFDSSWTFDTLVERHISEVQMPAAIFVKSPGTHGYEPYNGPKPGGFEPLPDIKVFTRTPWPGALILALPPTKPAPECISYIVRAHESRGAFDPARAKALGVTPGPDFGKLTRGESVQNNVGECITPDQVLAANRPGQGVAILDIPSVDYLDAIVQREELLSPHVMEGVGAIVWTLGPGLAGHATLTSFMAKLSNVQHVISSTDVAPNRITFDSVAGQTSRLSQIDPSRYAVPVYDNVSVPQTSLLVSGRRQTPTLPKASLRQTGA
jgi:ribonuclease Z